jgi:hypothetical protein
MLRSSHDGAKAEGSESAQETWHQGQEIFENYMGSAHQSLGRKCQAEWMVLRRELRTLSAKKPGRTRSMSADIPGGLAASQVATLDVLERV